MSSTSRVSLEDTLALLQLVRETALAQGREAQAKKIAPVVEQVSNLVTSSRSQAAAPSTGMLAQPDFRTLLEISQARTQPAGNTGAQSSGAMNGGVQNGSAGNGGVNGGAALERNRMIQAMAQADMSEVEIARQFGMAREEVRLVLSLNGGKSYNREVIP